MSPPTIATTTLVALPRPAAPNNSLATTLAHSVASNALPLDQLVPEAIWQTALLGPLLEFAARPSKAFRERLTRLAFLGCDGNPAHLPAQLGAIVEAIHAGSLVVDDVQDGSLERRGGPALHHSMGMPLAVNAGSWMYFYALSQLFTLPMVAGQHARVMQRAVQVMMRCHQGQALDLAIRIADVEPSHVAAVTEATTRGKTGALMGFAGFLGAATAGADAATCEAWATFGENLGVGLQMLDDVGSIVAADRSAKGFEDISQGRATWPWAWFASRGDDVSVRRLMLRTATTCPDEHRAIMETLAHAVGDYGRECAHAHLAQTIAHLEPFANAATLEALRTEIARLEASYG
jgi:geranylgeranyl pyrophosphate synthase